MGVEVLSRRTLNRATLERQLLLRRVELPVLAAVDHLVGLQAQVPRDPYTALWSRLDGFRPEVLSTLLEERLVVRMTAMRSTIHLVGADDCLLLAPLVRPLVDAEIARHPVHAQKLAGVDLRPVLSFARRLLAEPRTGPQLRAALAERFPAHDPAALAFACRTLALVQTPPRGIWQRSAQVTLATAESWLGRPPASSLSLDDLVLRYLGAFGPATVADVATWSRLTGLRAVVERLRDRLVTFRDERGRELFDLAHAPRPDPGTPAPPRFLPEYDNVLLSHADRTRFLSDHDRSALAEGWTVGLGRGAARRGRPWPVAARAGTRGRPSRSAREARHRLGHGGGASPRGVPRRRRGTARAGLGGRGAEARASPRQRQRAALGRKRERIRDRHPLREREREPRREAVARAVGVLVRRVGRGRLVGAAGLGPAAERAGGGDDELRGRVEIARLVALGLVLPARDEGVELDAGRPQRRQLTRGRDEHAGPAGLARRFGVPGREVDAVGTGEVLPRKAPSPPRGRALSPITVIVRSPDSST